MLARYVLIANVLADLRDGRQSGQGLAEYALILVMIAVLAILALVFLGSQIRTLLSNVGTSI
jgi:Flp pilus assembly pilin Flp